MRGLTGTAVAAGVCLLAGLVWAGPSHADIVIAIDKGKQRMAVLVDGKEEYLWKVSTGTGGGPRSGTYRPQRLEKSWFSHKYGMSPMPHSIFFHEGFAIHGTIYLAQLGSRASHGCVRLHPANAKTLFELVRARGPAITTITIANAGFAIPAPPAPKIEPALLVKPEPAVIRPIEPAPAAAAKPLAPAPKADAVPAITSPEPASLPIPEPAPVVLPEASGPAAAEPAARD